MKTVIWNETTQWEEAVRQGEEEEVVILRDGRPVALLVPFDEEDLEWFSRERDPGFLQSLAGARKQVREGETVSQGQLKTRLGI